MDKRDAQRTRHQKKGEIDFKVQCAHLRSTSAACVLVAW